VSTPERADPLRVDAEVAENRLEGGTSRRLRLAVPAGWPDAAPGPFVMVHLGRGAGVVRHDPLLPRPMAVYRTLRGEGGPPLVELLYKVVGRGTALMAALRPGDRVRLVGPLGRGFPAPAPGERALLVGGGTGIASLHDLAARAGAGASAVVLLGARTASDLMGRADFEALPAELRIATEDGSAGARGLVTELLEAALREEGPTRVYACGPTPMMAAAARLAREAGAPCVVSLENRMACGFGVCLGCAVPRAGEGFDLVCRDGPVFAADALRWEGLP
jgi:dihydroorotate dehydrogenase electron transfer subunit